jgi:hypothetical protein
MDLRCGMVNQYPALAALLGELLEGPAQGGAFMLNGGDRGLLGSLEQLSAAEASATPIPGNASIAAHVDHVRYGFELMNRWAGGERNPWATADWTASWRRTTVNDAAWRDLRDQLASETRHWREALTKIGEISELELKGVIGSVGHLAYHLGAIRQIAPSLRGPKAEGAGD